MLGRVPVHGRSMQSTCPRCEFYDRQAPCDYRAVGGLLRLVCSVCDRRADDESGRNWLDDPDGVFGIAHTPSLVELVQDFQTDLTAVLEGERSARTWGFERSGTLLLTVTTDLTLAFVLSTGLRVEARLDCNQVIRREARANWSEPIALALISPFMAFGLIALTASMLRSLSARGPVQHQWTPITHVEPLDVRSVLSWLDVKGRHWLRAFAAGWDVPTRRAVLAAIAQVEGGSDHDVRSARRGGGAGRRAAKSPSTAWQPTVPYC